MGEIHLRLDVLIIGLIALAAFVFGLVVFITANKKGKL